MRGFNDTLQMIATMERCAGSRAHDGVTYNLQLKFTQLVHQSSTNLVASIPICSLKKLMNWSTVIGPLRSMRSHTDHCHSREPAQTQDTYMLHYAHVT